MGAGWRSLRGFCLCKQLSPWSLPTIVNRWNSLSITEEEEGVLDDSLLNEGAEDLKLGLIGQNTFVFSFKHEIEKRRILEGEPWCFSKSLLVLKEFDDLESPGQGDYRFVKFWVRMFNLPLHGMTEGIGRYLENRLGRCIEVEMDKNGHCWGHYLRVRVQVDVTMPLMRGMKVRLGFSVASGNFDHGDWIKAPSHQHSIGAPKIRLVSCTLESRTVSQNTETGMRLSSDQSPDEVARGGGLHPTDKVVTAGTPTTFSNSSSPINQTHAEENEDVKEKKWSEWVPADGAPRKATSGPLFPTVLTLSLKLILIIVAANKGATSQGGKEHVPPRKPNLKRMARGKKQDGPNASPCIPASKRKTQVADKVVVEIN
ncbi:hypothetical protein PanWU01x14_096750 [Parasponia andersonii]|uniref:Uncharacterized protein n=1 Tax=Parasponia andersonii TaxID=3476 RepID=A0A2P5D517_PARAD|nr:hypothetical protein PanWU01x14_096750 [Parasponia andersonii]